MTRHLVIFVKAPRVGAVKTRLARTLGRVGAWALYKKMTADVLRRLGRGRWRIHLFVTPDVYADRGRFWPSSLKKVKQGRGDLGQRMQRAFDILPPGPVVLIGSDIPDIRADHIERAFKELKTCDAVFGPATDGGYWLVGQRRLPKTGHFFHNVRWSTEHTLADTLKNVPCYGLVDILSDVDHPEDLLKKPLSGAVFQGSQARRK